MGIRIFFFFCNIYGYMYILEKDIYCIYWIRNRINVTSRGIFVQLMIVRKIAKRDTIKCYLNN